MCKITNKFFKCTAINVLRRVINKKEKKRERRGGRGRWKENADRVKLPMYDTEQLVTVVD